nr:uncharacterized protein LOC111748856 [Loxodonta africana]
MSPLTPAPLEKGICDSVGFTKRPLHLVCEVTGVFVSIGVCVVCLPTRPPAHSLSPQAALGACVYQHWDMSPPVCLLSASKYHMPPNFAENRKSCQFEGNPVIHQGMTVQLLVCPPPLQWGHCPEQLLPPPLGPQPAWRSRESLDFALSPLRRHGQTLLGPSFYLSSWLFGVGRLRNVVCCNVWKRGAEKQEPGLLAAHPLALHLWRLPALLGSPVPLPSHLNMSHCLPPTPCAWTHSAGHSGSLGFSCGFQLFKAAVVASSEGGCGSATDETRGAIYSRVALGPEQSLRLGRFSDSSSGPRE